jgi:hypothetical protein
MKDYTGVGLSEMLGRNSRASATHQNKENSSFYVFCTVHCHILIQCKPMKCTLPKLIF